MASTIPPPPFLGPLTGVPVTGQYPDWVNLYLLRWDENQQTWVTLGWGQHPWDSFPSGYYATAHLDADGNVDWGPHSTVIVVAGRSKPDGTAAPFVLEDPPAAQLPDPRCPPNMWFTNRPDQFNVIPGALLCSWLPPPPQQVCPEGTYWDPTTETCKAIALPPPIIFPPIPPPPPPAPVETGQPDPYGDEITQTLCLQMAANTAALISAIQQLQPGGGGAADPRCCAAVVTAIGAVANVLARIFGLLEAKLGTPPPPLDLTQIVTELTAMAASLNALATAPAMDLAPLTAAINDVARAIASAAPADVSGIVQQLALQVGDEELSLAAVQYLNDGGFLSPDQVTFYSRGRLQ